MNELTPPPKPYEPYQGCSMEDFANDFLNNKPMTLQAFCMKERIDPYDLPRLVQEVLVDWELIEAKHGSRRDAMTHLINHLRIKIRHEQRNNNAQRSLQSSGRGQHRNPDAYDLAREILGKSSG